MRRHKLRNPKASRGNRPNLQGIALAMIEALENRQMLSVNVLTWHNDAGRTGLNSNEQILTPADVNISTFGKLFSYPVTGQVYAQPLYVSNLAIPGMGTHNVILVATQDNDVYAFDANSNTGVGAGLLWHVNLGLAAAVPNSYFGDQYGPYHDINPQVGITSTPVIDLSTDTMYVDAFTNDVAGQNVYSHHIHALDITTGQDKVAPMLVAAAVKGNGVGGDGTTVTFSAEQQMQRPALTLVNGVLYATYGSYADSNPYHGWILGFNPGTLALQSVFNDTPNLLTIPTTASPGEGGIWQAGAGLASDGTNLFLMVGNGDFQASVGDYGDSILKVTPNASTPSAPNIDGYGLGVSDYFTPFNQLQLSQADEDLGSGGGLVVPTQSGTYPHEFIGGGKQGLIYVVNLDNMGKFSSTTDNVIQEVNIGNGLFSSPAYFNSAIYYHAVGDVLKKYTLTNGLLSTAPAAQTNMAYPYPGATPSISSNGTTNGIVWDVYAGTHGVLHAYDAGTLAELYNSDQSGTRDQLGTPVKFVTPTIADGEVFVATTGAVTVFGLLTPPTAAPTAPSNLLATAPTASTVKLTWVNNSNQQSGIKIERSLDNLNFVQIALTSANAVSYTDTSVNANVLYYYRIRATNIIGDSAYTTPSASVTTPSGTTAVDVYHFEAGAGTVAADSAGTNPGTLVGSVLPQWVTPGAIGNSALSFSGDGIYNQTASESAVKVNNDLSPVLGSTSSLDVWIKTTQVGSDIHWEAPAITGVEQAQGGNDINWGTLDATGRIGLWVGDYGSVFSTNPINDGKWHNIAMTRDAVNGTVQLFVDGVLNSSAILEAGNKTSHFYLIGALSDVKQDGATPTGDNYFNGSLDEVRIYPAVLGQNDISALAVVPAAPVLQSATVATGPVIHLTFTSPSSYAQSLEVDRMNGSSGSFVPLATLPATATVYDDTTVTAGVSYSYELKAIDAVGSSLPSNVLTVSPALPTVVANVVFYNQSKFDGLNGSSNLTDDNAIATDKTALLPGGTASFANVTSYSSGINGIMIDVANLVNVPGVGDFTFRVGNDNNPAGWVAAPAPTYVNTYPGRGPGGSTQITLMWNNNAIQDEWLQVTMLAQPHLGLGANDVFYFGNAIGETGNSSTDVLVTAADAARVNANFIATAPVTDAFDINRDGVVNATDATLAGTNLTTKFNGLNLISLAAGAPIEPTGVTAVAAVGSVALRWTASPGVVSYNIYRGTVSGGEGNTPIATGVSGMTYSDSSLPIGAYYYFVTAVNSALTLPAAESAASAQMSAAVTAVKLTGTPIGTAASWNPTSTIVQAFDGNLNTYFDPANSNLTNWVGLDLGAAETIGQIKYAPRANYAYRMVGAKFQVSSTADFSSNVVTLYTIVATPVYGQFTTINVNPGGAYRYVRYTGGTQWVNIAEMEVDGIVTNPPPVIVKLTGTAIGTAAAWSPSSTVAAAFDGNFNTYFDPANGSLTNWVGLDLGTARSITQIKYAPRSGYEWRMIGAQFQVCTTADFSSNVVTLATITAAPPAGQFTTVYVNPGSAYRYIRYTGGNQWVNIAEMEVDGL